MCKTASLILTNDYKALTHPHSDRHEDIIEKYKLKDDQIKTKREWLRIELLPQKSLISTNKEEWKFHLDEEQPYPKWYNYDMAVNACWEHLLKEIRRKRYQGEWKGSLDLEGTGITSLPDNLSVGGSLDLRGTGITSLPDNLSVGGNIYKNF